MSFFQLPEEMMKPMADSSFFTAMIPTPEKMQETARDMMALNPFAQWMPFADGFPRSMTEAGTFGFPAFKDVPFASALPVASPVVGAAATGQAVAMGSAAQIYGAMFGAMTGAMGAASKVAKSEFEMPKIPGKVFNPLTFEWAFSGVEGSEKPESKADAKVAAKVTAKAETKVAANVETKATAPVKAEAKKPEIRKPEAKKVDAAKSAKTAAPNAKPAAEKAAPEPVAEPVAAVEPVAETLPEDFVKPKGIAKPGVPDDLKLIAGVGPKLEKVLNDLGIWTFAQVAAWTPNEVAWVDDFLQFKGRIDRDDWIAQADALAAGGRDEYVKRFGQEPR